MTEETPETPPARSNAKAMLIIGGIAVLVLGVVAALVLGLGLLNKLDAANPANAETGSCLTEAPNAAEVKIADCAAAEAKFTVLAVFDGKTEAEARAECGKVKDAKNYLVTYADEPVTETSRGRALCIAPKA